METSKTEMTQAAHVGTYAGLYTDHAVYSGADNRYWILLGNSLVYVPRQDVELFMSPPHPNNSK